MVGTAVSVNSFTVTTFLVQQRRRPKSTWPFTNNLKGMLMRFDVKRFAKYEASEVINHK